MSSSNNQKLAIIFDFGGVLFDWDPYKVYDRFFYGNRQAITRFFEEIGFIDWNVQQDQGRPFATAVEELSQKFPHHAGLIQAYDTYWEESVTQIQPTVEILKKLKTEGFTLFALSNWSEEKFELIRPHYAFLKQFDDILVSGSVKMIKPDPRIYQILIERNGYAAEHCLFIDDSSANIRAAQELGFQTILYRSAEQLEGELVARGLLNPEKASLYRS